MQVSSLRPHTYSRIHIAAIEATHSTAALLQSMCMRPAPICRLVASGLIHIAAIEATTSTAALLQSICMRPAPTCRLVA
jgi:hypothetical protein